MHAKHCANGVVVSNCCSSANKFPSCYHLRWLKLSIHQNSHNFVFLSCTIFLTKATSKRPQPIVGVKNLPRRVKQGISRPPRAFYILSRRGVCQNPPRLPFPFGVSLNQNNFQGNPSGTLSGFTFAVVLPMVFRHIFQTELPAMVSGS